MVSKPLVFAVSFVMSFYESVKTKDAMKLLLCVVCNKTGVEIFFCGQCFLRKKAFTQPLDT